jgi:hypothetical protein
MSFCSQKRAVTQPVLDGTGHVRTAALERASFRLVIGTPVQVRGIFRATPAARALNAPFNWFLKRGQLKNSADDSGDNPSSYRLSRPNAMSFQALRVRAAVKTTIPRALNCRASCPI